VFSTTAAEASTPTERMRIVSTGNILFNFDGSSATGVSQFADGTASAPGITFWADGSNDTGIYRPGANILGFTTGGTERVRIDSSGRLLVGSSIGGDVNYGGGTGGFHLVNGNADPHLMIRRAGGNGSLTLVRSNGTVAAPTVVANNDVIGQIRFVPYDGTDYTLQCARISAEIDGTPGANDVPGRLVFSTTADGASSPTERMRITNDGRTTCFSSGQGLTSVVSAAAGTTVQAIVAGHSSTSLGTGTASFRVWSNGNVENTNDSYGAISDIKLKENIVDAESQWDDFKAVRFRKYNFKEETGHETFTQLGVIAQELELVSPGLVAETPDLDEDGNDLGTTTKSVKYSILTKKALVALQEAMERIETLEAKVAALETK
jgi:hypothetical protein